MPPAKRWSIHPDLHDEVATKLDEEGLFCTFYDVDNDEGHTHERITNIMGRFRCHNKNCRSNGWSSNVVATFIRMYPGSRYNARVYHQSCRACGKVSKPRLDFSYAERIVYWIKKWNDVPVERPPVSSHSRGPHDSALCEGCRAGRCPMMINRRGSASSDSYIDLMERYVDFRLYYGCN